MAATKAELFERIRRDSWREGLSVLRMSYSGKAVHRVTATMGQEAPLDGHVHAFFHRQRYPANGSSGCIPLPG